MSSKPLLCSSPVPPEGPTLDAVVSTSPPSSSLISSHPHLILCLQCFHLAPPHPLFLSTSRGFPAGHGRAPSPQQPQPPWLKASKPIGTSPMSCSQTSPAPGALGPAVLWMGQPISQGHSQAMVAPCTLPCLRGLRRADPFQDALKQMGSASLMGHHIHVPF